MHNVNPPIDFDQARRLAEAVRAYHRREAQHNQAARVFIAALGRHNWLDTVVEEALHAAADELPIEHGAAVRRLANDVLELRRERARAAP